MSVIDSAKLAARAALDKKASRVVIQDLHGQSDLCRLQLICSGANERQTQAICQNIEEVLKRKHNSQPLAIEGKQTGQWILMDYGDTIIHIFLNSVRDYYAMDTLWKNATNIDVHE